MVPFSAPTRQLGHSVRGDFLFDDAFLNLNHGSFGTYPRAVRSALRLFQDRVEASPDAFIRYEYPKLLDEARKALARVLNAPTETIVLIPNSTTGINIVLRSLVFEANDSIVYFSTIYGACEKTVEYIAETTPAQAVKVQYLYPVEDDWLVEEFIRTVKHEQAGGRRVRVAIFDTVSSLPGVRMPFESLVQACKDLGVLSLVDGAHGIGHVALDLEQLDCDFLVSNCHKWLFVPRGAAVFYVPVRNQHLIRSTLPTSHGFQPKPRPGVRIINPLPISENSPYVENFGFVGTIDNSNYLCVPAALKYRESLGGEEAIRQYCTQLARKAGQYVAQILGTEVLENSTATLGNCCMTNIRLPIPLQQAMAFAPSLTSFELGTLVRDWLTARMVQKYHTFMALIFYNNAWWVRLSGQVYLEMADFEKGAEVLKTLSQDVVAGRFLPSASAKL